MNSKSPRASSRKSTRLKSYQASSIIIVFLKYMRPSQNSRVWLTLQSSTATFRTPWTKLQVKQLVSQSQWARPPRCITRNISRVKPHQNLIITIRKLVKFKIKYNNWISNKMTKSYNNRKPIANQAYNWKLSLVPQNKIIMKASQLPSQSPQKLELTTDK